MPVPCLLKRYAKLGPSWPIFPVLGCKSGLEQRDGTALRAPSTLDALSGGLDSCETEENKSCARGCDTTSRVVKANSCLIGCYSWHSSFLAGLILVTRLIKYG